MQLCGITLRMQDLHSQVPNKRTAGEGIIKTEHVGAVVRAVVVWEPVQLAITNESVLTFLEVRLDQGGRHFFSPHPRRDSVNSEEQLYTFYSNTILCVSKFHNLSKSLKSRNMTYCINLNRQTLIVIHMVFW